MVRPERFELPTYCSGGNRSIQLSYGRTFVILHEGIQIPNCQRVPVVEAALRWLLVGWRQDCGAGSTDVRSIIGA